MLTFLEEVCNHTVTGLQRLRLIAYKRRFAGPAKLRDQENGRS